MRNSTIAITITAALLCSCGASRATDDGAHVGPDHRDHAMTHGFGDVERWLERFEEPGREAWQKPERVVALMETAAGMTVADIGAGTGYFMSYLSGAVGRDGRVLALDIEPALVDYMRERAARGSLANVQARLIGPDDPGLEEASVDRVLIVNTWHHIAHRVGYAGKIAAGLKPGGRLLIVDFTLESSKGPSAEHKLSAAAVVEELTAAGMTARVLAEDLPEQYVVEGGRIP